MGEREEEDMAQGMQMMAESKADDESKVDDEAKGEPAPKAEDKAAPEDAFDDGREKPTHLSIDSTPEFMQLPLEYQGFCPWTIVHRHGLLLPGKPAIGVIRYSNRFFVFSSGVALEAFKQNPDKYIRGVVNAARESPELIHLLRLQEDFPQSSISKLLKSVCTLVTRVCQLTRVLLV